MSQDETEVVASREEGSSKNPVHHRLRLDAERFDRDVLNTIASRARDLFHQVIGHPLGRRYRRPPIVLVDDWVIGALGLFTRQTLHAMAAPPPSRTIEPAPGPRERSAVRDPSPYDPPAPPAPRAPASPLAPAFRVFDAFAAVKRVADSVAGLVKVGDLVSDLAAWCTELVHALASEDADLRRARTKDARAALGRLVAVVSLLPDALGSSPTLAPRVVRELVDTLATRAQDLAAALDAVETAPPVRIHAIGFDLASGLVFHDLPELEVEGPAILVAPARVQGWVERWWSRARPPFDPRAAARHFGASAAHLPLAVALGNVIAHELTHALVQLPTDPTTDERDLAAAKWVLYRELPGLEEGLAQFLAALTTLYGAVRAMRDLRGKGLPVLTGREAGQVDACFPLLIETFGHYFEGEARAFLETWDRTRNLKAFGGLVAMLATDTTRNDWRATLAALRDGVIIVRGLGH